MTFSSQHHSFDIAIAAKYGIEEAILIHHFMHWVRINTRCGRNEKQFEVDGQKIKRFFTYQSRKEIQLHFPYWNYDRVKYLCEKLVQMGVLFACNFNKSPIDKTLWYAFVDPEEFNLTPQKVNNIYDNSTNSYEGQKCPSKGKSAQPIPDTKTTDTLKKNKKTPSASAISLNSETKKFEGVSEEDIKRWQTTFPAVNVRKELQEALLWALNSPRKNYRRSLDVWMSNVNKSHTTPFKEGLESSVPASQEDFDTNKKWGESWELEFSKNPVLNYGVQSSQTKITFILPNNEGYSVDFSNPKSEYLKLCQKAVRRMKLKTLVLMNTQKITE